METFNFVPAYEHEESQGYRVLVSTFETGTEQRRIKRREPREWDLGFVGTIAFIKSIHDFYDRHYGAGFAFNWTPCGESEELTVRFKTERRASTIYGQTSGSISLSIIEILTGPEPIPEEPEEPEE